VNKMDRIGMSDQIAVRLIRGGGRMETKELKIGDKKFKLQRLGNLTFMQVTTTRNPTEMIAKLIQLTVIEPTLSQEDLECMDPEVFYKLLEEVFKINKFDKIIQMTQTIGKFLQTTSSVPKSGYVA